MPNLLSKFIKATLYPAALLLIFASSARSGVAVFDRVTTVKTPVYLKVLTKGRFFAEGGRLVDIYIDNTKLKRILTGGDGYGYLKYTPPNPGLTRIEARSDGDRDTGIILVMEKNDPVIFIEIEGGFKDSIFSEEFKVGSRKAVETLSQKYKIIYINRYLGTGMTRNWLEKEKFPESVILRWQDSQIFDELKEKGIKLYAVIGSASLISAAAKHIERRYTFDETKEGQTVKDWEEILELLQNDDAKAPSKASNN